MKRSIWKLFACLSAVSGALFAQATGTTTPAGVLYPTQNSAHVNGVRIQVDSDGAIWFLESSADIIARLKDGVMRQWQIRPTNELGANPVDFQIDGQYVWLIESGESQIPAGSCAYARLDTVSGELTEYVIPGTIPAAFYRAPDGTVWIPQSASALQAFNPQTLTVTSYRSPGTFSYADMVVGPDGAFWLADFGNNRIVRWVPGAPTETSWTFYDPSVALLQPSQIQFDEQGYLWITERTGNRVDRFDATTNTLASYQNILAPVHFEIFQGRLYISNINTTSQITVLDPGLAAVGLFSALTPVTLTVGTTPSVIPVTIRESNIPPTDFASAPAAIDPSTFTVTNPNGTQAGVLTTTFPASNTYGIAVNGGHVWAGTDGNLAELNLQATGNPTDVSVPVATALMGSAQVDVTVSNRGTSSLPGQAQYLYSPGAFAGTASYTLSAGATTFLANAFGSLGTSTTLLNGPVRLGATGSSGDFLASVRSSRVLSNGGTFGYLFPADGAASSLAPGSTASLFTGANSGELSILNFYSLDDATTTMTLTGPDGRTRGTQTFDIAKNASFSFTPASSAFGVAPEPGDVVTVGVTAGTLQASMLVFDAGTTDVLPMLPEPALTSSVIPWVGSFPNGDRSFSSDLYLWNASPDASAVVTIAFYGVGATGAPPTTTIAIAPGETRVLIQVLLSLYGIDEGQGALTISSSVPVVAAVRVATSVAAGDYGTFANAMDASGGAVSGTSVYGIGLPQTATRSGLLLLYNAGAEGTVTITGTGSNGVRVGTLTVPMASQYATVVGPVFAAMGVSKQDAGRVRIDVSDGMRVFGWTADTDQITGDIDLTPLR